MKRTPPELPPPFLWAVIGLTVLLPLLNLMGVRLDASLTRGPHVHALLEWTSFCIAVFTVVLAFTHFFLRRDVSTPIIGTALFCSGLMDAFLTLTADGLITPAVDQQRFVPFAWAMSRTFNVLIILVGASMFLGRGAEGLVRTQRRGLRFVLLVATLFGVVAYSVIHLCAVSPSLPQMVFSSQPVPRPWDAVPLALYLIAGGIVLPKFYQRHPSLFSYGLLLSVVPHIATQMYAAFGSTEMYDNGFIAARCVRLVAYGVPLAGLILEYSRASRAEGELRAAREKLRLARLVQESLFPESHPASDTLEVAGMSVPADAMGGDFFDYLPLPDGSLCVAVVDVSGHDIGASALMAQSRGFLRALAHRTSDAAELVRELNRFVSTEVRGHRMATGLLARLAPEHGHLQYAAAGHNAWLIAADGNETELPATGPVLGIGSAASFSLVEHPFRAGDLFVCTTDGVLEAESLGGMAFGSSRLLDTVVRLADRPVGEIVSGLDQAVREFTEQQPQVDDITIVVARAGGRHGSSEPPAAEPSPAGNSESRENPETS